MAGLRSQIALAVNSSKVVYTKGLYSRGLNEAGGQADEIALPAHSESPTQAHARNKRGIAIDKIKIHFRGERPVADLEFV